MSGHYYGGSISSSFAFQAMSIILAVKCILNSCWSQLLAWFGGWDRFCGKKMDQPFPSYSLRTGRTLPRTSSIKWHFSRNGEGKKLVNWLVDLLSWNNKLRSSIDWLIIEQSIDWLIIEQSIDWLIDWLICLLIDWLLDWLICYLSIDWLIDWPII